MFRTLLISLFLTSTALADTWTVDDDGKADFNNIQAAVDAASDGDEIIVAPGYYAGHGGLEGYEMINMLGKSIILRSSDGPEVTIIDAWTSVRGIACASGETPECVIRGFTITNCRSTDFDYDGNGNLDVWEDGCGGGIYISSSSPTIIDCVITNNIAAGWDGWWGADIYSFGGGIYMYNSNATLTDCVISQNSANDEYFGMGGGIHMNSSSPTLTNCELYDNSASTGGMGWSGTGGGISMEYYSDPSLINCNIVGNATGDGVDSPGGGLYMYLCNPSLTDCTIMQNSATHGGGIVCYWSNPTLNDCSISGNVAAQSGSGDGIYARDVSLVTFEDYCVSEDEFVFVNMEHPYTNPAVIMAFSAESICDVAADVTPSGEGATTFDIDDLDTTASLLTSGTFTQQGSLAVTNESGSLIGAQAGDVIPLAQASNLEGEFNGTVFPLMPEGLGLQLVEYPALRGGDTEMAVEVIEVEGAQFANPFAGGLDSPPIDITSFDADGDGADEIAVLFDGAPGGVAVFAVSEDGAPSLIDGFSAIVGNNPVDLDAGDLDGDGLVDLLVANSTSETITVLVTTLAGDGTLTFTDSTINISDMPTCVSVIDWDDDAELDAVIGINITNPSALDGYQVLLDVATTASGGPWFPIPYYELLSGDYVSDSPTCVHGGNQTSAWGFVGGTQYGRVHRVIPNGSLQIVAELGGINIVTIEAIELDADGGDLQIDLMVSSDEAELVYLFQGNASETDGFGDLIPVAVSEPVEDLVALDADDDGDMDIVMTAPTSDTPLVLLRNDGGGTALVGGLNGITWSKQAMESGNPPKSIAGGTLGGKDEDDDWIVGAGDGVGLRGKEMGTMEQTNIQFGTPCQSDLDGDGEVKVADLLILIGAWGPCANCDADLDGDGEVKVADLLLLIGAWGPCE